MCRLHQIVIVFISSMVLFVSSSFDLKFDLRPWPNQLCMCYVPIAGGMTIVARAASCLLCYNIDDRLL